MIAVAVNIAAVVAGSLCGLVFKKGLPKKLSDSIMQGLALCVLYIGISGSLKCENTLCVILSMVIGIITGELLKLDDRINSLGQKLETRFSTDENSSFARGFVSATLLFCVGAMSIVGSLESGIAGRHDTIFSKSLIDGISAIIFTSTFGVGVMFSAVGVLVYQGTITLLAQFIAPFLTDYVVNQMTAVGSLVIIGLAFNMLGLTKIKVMNMVPAIFIPIILCKFM